MISVCMATHNGEKYLKQQLESILCQLGDSDEIIISDDGSTDSTIEIIRSLSDSRIKLLEFNSPEGLPGHEKATLNFENALKNASGDVIFLSDQDDVWLPDKVATCERYLQECHYVVSDAFVTNDTLEVISQTRYLKEEKVHFNKYAAVFFATPYQGSCAAFTKDVLKKAIPFPKGIQSHDRWIGNVAAFYFKINFAPEKLIYYRRHEGTASDSLGMKKKKTFKSLISVILYKFRYLYGLVSIINR